MNSLRLYNYKDKKSDTLSFSFTTINYGEISPILNFLFGVVSCEVANPLGLATLFSRNAAIIKEEVTIPCVTGIAVSLVNDALLLHAGSEKDEALDKLIKVEVIYTNYLIKHEKYYKFYYRI